jgi:hypothetical protein
MVELKLEDNLKKGKPLDYFYGTLKKSGFYRRPAGYKSFTEQALDRQKQRLSDRKRLLREMEETALRISEIEQDIAFQQMLQEPQGELYQHCFSLLNPIQQKLTRADLINAALREIFRSVWEQKHDNVIPFSRINTDDKPLSE